ncbi:MAG: hypothetical protein HOH66_06615, partial [Rhodospirillaceae bacterium]|nr:hypothetical protein [Rhodospirillaceae bacterium]
MNFRRIGIAVAFCGLLSAPAAADYATGLTAFRTGDFATAVVELQVSAEIGDADSQYLLGQINENGLGVPQNFLRAHVWYNLAAASGHEAAANARDALAKRMAPDQVAKAQSRASEWLPVDAGDRGPLAFSVANTQQMLIDLGYDPGSADGILKTQTRAAIRKYQEKAKLPTDGRLTPELFSRLVKSAGREVQAAKATETMAAPAPQPAQPAAQEDPATKLVTDIQARLRQLGYAVPSVSGRIDEETRTAIRTYEADQGMPVTGQASQAVLDRMVAQDRAKAADERNLIQTVQSRLNALGYDAGPADGAMGGRTTSAIQLFEKERGLPVTGNPSAELAANLDAALGEREAAEGKKEEKKDAPAPKAELVLAVETELNKRGYNAGVEDGTVTEDTEIAVSAYQKDAGIEVNGMVTEELLAHIEANTPSEADDAMSPAQITDLERELEARGYRAGAVDGRVDGDLRAAIRMYQADSGVEVTGEP